MTKWCLFPMFVLYCVAFGIAALALGPKALILPAVETGILGTLCLAFWAVTPKEQHGH